MPVAGAGGDTFVMPSLAQALVSTNGWRAAYACLGMLVIVIAASTVGLRLKETPAMMGLQPDGESQLRLRVRQDTKPGNWAGLS